MADAIVRLKVESQEYDQKLQRATQQLQHMEKEVRRTGATFAYADKEELAFVKSLGTMETKATSAKQKMREYSEAITSMVAMYRQMTAEEKSSQYGKALSASIDQLKVKAAELQDIMSDTNREITNLASDTSFTEGISLMTRTIGASAAAITAWTGESKEMDAVIKDLAKIGTTVAAVEALTKAFQKQNLVLLKNPYVLAAAGVAALGVAIGKLIQKQQELSAVEKDLQEVQKKGREDSAKEVTRIQTLNNILHDNTRSLDERKAALSEIQALVPEYHGALTTEGTLINDNADALNNYIANLQRAATAQAAFDRMVEINKQKLEKQLALNEANKKLAKAQEDYNRPVSRDEMLAQAGSGRNVYGAVANTKQTILDAAQSEVDGLEAEIKEFNKEIETLQTLVNSSALVTATGKGGRKGGGVGGKTIKTATGETLPVFGSLGDWEQQAAQVQQYMKGATSTEEYKELEADLEFILEKIREIKGEKEVTFAPGSLNDLNQQLSEAQSILANLAPDTEAWAAALQDVATKTAAVQALQAKMGTGVQSTTDDAKDMHKAFSAAASAVATVGGALQQIEDPAAKVAGIIAAAIAQVALTFASSLKGTIGPWDWIAAATAGLATMISTITAIKSVTSSAKGYAEGGMVGGNSYSGDNIVARLNSGEGVLTAQGVQNASNLFDGSRAAGGQMSQPYLTGDVIILGVNNYLGRSGQGEIVTTSMLRRAGIRL